MNLKDILIHIDNRPTCTSRMKTAIALAKRQDARVTGLYVIPHPYYASHHRNPLDKAEEAKQDFVAAVEAAGLEYEWICVDSARSGLDLPNALNLYAHYRDLVVVSQTDMEHPDRTIPPNLPEKAVLGSGRPVLIVPYTGDHARIGDQIMLAWRGGPESSRALHDSLPLLRKAEHVQVITIQGLGGDEAYHAHDADIVSHMARYKLNLSSEKHVTGNLKIGDLLLNRCADEGIDLMVFGAFSEFRRGHQVLGETGRYLLEYMTVPVLMSH